MSLYKIGKLMMTTTSILKKRIYQNWIKYDSCTGFQSLWEILNLFINEKKIVQYFCGMFCYWASVQSQNPANKHNIEKKTKAQSGSMTILCYWLVEKPVLEFNLLNAVLLYKIFFYLRFHNVVCFVLLESLLVPRV